MPVSGAIRILWTCGTFFSWSSKHWIPFIITSGIFTPLSQMSLGCHNLGNDRMSNHAWLKVDTLVILHLVCLEYRILAVTHKVSLLPSCSGHPTISQSGLLLIKNSSHSAVSHITWYSIHLNRHHVIPHFSCSGRYRRNVQLPAAITVNHHCVFIYRMMEKPFENKILIITCTFTLTVRGTSIFMPGSPQSGCEEIIILV